MIAAAADEPYLDFMRREIFTPLGMVRTVPDVAGQTEADRAHFCYPRVMLNPRYGVHDAPAVDLSCHLPAVGFLSTPSDLVRFGAAMMSDTLLDPATREELQTLVRLESQELSGHALGWTVRSVPMGTDGAVTMVGQGLGEAVVRRPFSATTGGGQVAGGTASLITVPEHGIAIAVTADVSGADSVWTLTVRLADVFIGARETR